VTRTKTNYVFWCTSLHHLGYKEVEPQKRFSSRPRRDFVQTQRFTSGDSRIDYCSLSLLNSMIALLCLRHQRSLWGNSAAVTLSEYIISAFFDVHIACNHLHTFYPSIKLTERPKKIVNPIPCILKDWNPKSTKYPEPFGKWFGKLVIFQCSKKCGLVPE
jgi:hypothetical protein